MTEPATALSSEMSVVVKTARVGDLADGLLHVQHGPAMQQTLSVITERMKCVQEELLTVKSL
jgi:hypothetical protein